MDRRGFRDKLHQSGTKREGISNISLVREGVMEVIVREDSYDGFVSSMCESGFKVDPSMDPMDEKDPLWLAQPGESISARVKQNFIDRLRRDIKTVKKRDARDFLSEWINVVN